MAQAPAAAAGPDDRLTKLEKSVRFWRWFSMGVGGMFLLVTLGQGWLLYSSMQVLRTRKVEIVNAKGVAVEISADADGEGQVSIRNGKGDPRIVLGTSRKNTGLIDIYGMHEERVAGLGGTASGGMLVLFNSSGHRVVDVQALKNNCGAVMVHNFDGELRHSMSGEDSRMR